MPSTSPRLVVLGDLPPALVQLASSAEVKQGHSLCTRFEGLTWLNDADGNHASTGGPRLSQLPACTPVIMVEDSIHQRRWRADLVLLAHDDAVTNSSSSSSSHATIHMTLPSSAGLTGTNSNSSIAARREPVAVPRAAVVRIVPNSWREESQINESSPSPPPVVMDEAITSPVEDVPQGDHVVDAQAAGKYLPIPASADAIGVVTSKTHADAVEPSSSRTPAAAAADVPSVLAGSQITPTSLLERGGPHWNLVQELVHALATATDKNPCTLSQLHQLVAAKQSRWPLQYSRADVQYVLDDVLGTSSRTSTTPRGYTLRPSVYVALVDVDDFPRGTRQRDVATRLFTLLNPADAAQRAQREALAYLVDRDLVLATSASLHQRHHGSIPDTTTQPPHGATEETDEAMSSSHLREHGGTGQKRVREEDSSTSASADSLSPPPPHTRHYFTTVQQLDVHWDDGDLRQLLPDEMLARLRTECAALKMRATELGLYAQASCAPDVDVPKPNTSHKKKSKAITTTASLTALSRPASEQLLVPTPIQTREAYESVREVFSQVNECYNTLRETLTAYDAVWKEMEYWVSKHGDKELYSEDVLNAIQAYWEAQMERLSHAKPLLDEIDAMRFLLYRDLRDWHDLQHFGVLFPSAPV